MASTSAKEPLKCDEVELFELFRQFYPLPEEDFRLLEKNFVPESFSKGSLIITPGQVQNNLYFIKSGVQMSYYETDSHRHVIAFTYPPDPCAIPESFAFQQPSPYYLTALTDSTADSIGFNDLNRLFDSSRHLERLFRIMTEAVLAGMIHRHVELHALSMGERYLRFCRRSPHLLQLVPHKYLASYLGIDPTNFSKLYNNVRI